MSGTDQKKFEPRADEVRKRPLVSVISPVFNEETIIEKFYSELTRVVDGIADQYDFEFLFTDNCSTDRTFEIISGLATRDSRVRAIRFSRNFGYQKSIWTGYIKSKGDAVIQLDSDLEDPPEIIIRFLENWREGFEIVHGFRRSRKENWVLHVARRLFYRLINFLSENRLPYDVAECRLVDRRVVEELRHVRDQSPYLRGMIAELGFRQTQVPYDRDKRMAGISKFRLPALVSLAIDGIVSQSILPLRLATLCGLSIFILSGLGMIGFAMAKIFVGADWPTGWSTTTLILVLLGIAMNALFIGIIGEYIGRIYKNTRQFPMTIIERTIGFDSENPGADPSSE